MNKTLMERARSMLSGAGLGHEFCAKAVDTACYLLNKSPSSALEDKTPQEVWTGKKTSLSHLRVFGCDAYVHVPKEKQTKLDSKSEKCIFIGYKNGLKSYKLWNLVRRKVVYSRDVVFREVKDVIKHKEAVDSEDGKLWKEAMVDEMTSLHKNEVWDLVELPVGRRPIGSKWVFKKKTNAKGKVEKYKARLVAKGYSQVLRIDFGDIFSPVAKVTFIRLLLSVVAVFDFEVEQMDVKTKFLHGVLEEEIYMKQYEGFAAKGKKELIQLSSKFDMKDLGVANYILGMEIKRDRAKRKLWLNQRKYVETILQRFNMHDSKPVKVLILVGERLSAEQCPKAQKGEEGMSRVPYASAIGSLMYAMVCIRPDFAHALGVLSRFMSKSGNEHWTTVKRVFRYLHGTSDYGLCY
eukprot:PITA_35717